MVKEFIVMLKYLRGKATGTDQIAIVLPELQFHQKKDVSEPIHQTLYKVKVRQVARELIAALKNFTTEPLKLQFGSVDTGFFEFDNINTNQTWNPNQEWFENKLWQWSVAKAEVKTLGNKCSISTPPPLRI